MKILLLIITAFCVTAGYCQMPDMYKRKPWEDPKFKNLFRNQLQQNYKLNKDTIIVVPYNNKTDRFVLQLKLDKRYMGSNGKGADVYAMMPYNMPCIVPDSTFRSSMPVAGFDSKIIPKGR